MDIPATKNIGTKNIDRMGLSLIQVINLFII